MVTTDNRAERVPINSANDIIDARQQGRAWAKHLGFSSCDSTLVATVISELVRNILNYAGRGEILLRVYHDNGKKGLEITARDNGPGIQDISRAMQQGYSTAGGLGLGLPGVRRVVDEFEIVSDSQGTIVTTRKSK